MNNTGGFLTKMSDTVKKINTQPVQQSAYQQNISNPVPKNEVPTFRQAVGQIWQISQDDPARGKQLQNDFTAAMKNPSSPFYRPYSMPTNQAVGELSKYGIDASVMNADWFSKNTDWQQGLIYNGTTNTPSRPGKKSTAAQNISYWTYQIWKSEQDTEDAEREWAALKEEVSYKASRSDLNYSDDDIINGIDWKKYPTLSKMEATKGVTPIELNRAVDFSIDDLYGVMWNARNGKPDGNLYNAMAHSALGEGNVWKDNPEIRAKLDRNNPDTYSVYSVGMTLNDAGLYFNVSSFNEDTLEQIRQNIDWNDQTAVKYYNDAVSAEDTTKKAEAELKELYSRVDAWIDKNKKSYEDIQKSLNKTMDSKYPTLSAMDKSIQTGGKVIDTTRAIDYRRQDFNEYVKKRCEERDSLLTGGETMNSIQENAVTEEPAPVQTVQPTEAPAMFADEGQTAAPATEAPEQPEQTPVPEQPKQPALPKMTDSEIAKGKSTDKKINDVASAIESATTNNEKIVWASSGSSFFNGTQLFFEDVKKNWQSVVIGMAKNSEKAVSQHYLETSLDNVYDIAKYEAVERQLAQDQQNYDLLKAKYGDIENYQDVSLEPTKTITANDVDVTLTWSEKQGKYIAIDVYAPTYGIFGMDDDKFALSYMEDSEGYRVNQIIDNILAEQNEKAKRVKAAQKIIEEGGDEAKNEVEQYKSLHGRIEKNQAIIDEGKDKYEQQRQTMEDSWKNLEIINQSLTDLGMEPVNIEKAQAMVDYLSEFYDEPALPTTGETSYQFINSLLDYAGMEATPELRKEKIALYETGIDNEIDKIHMAMDYVSQNGYKVPDSINRNLQFKLEDLENRKQMIAYDKILTDTDPEELKKTIEAGKKFEAEHGEDNNMLMGMDNTLAYGFTDNTVASEEEKDIYYFLLGQSALAHEEEYNRLTNGSYEDIVKSETLLDQILQTSTDYLRFMWNDDYGVWTARTADETAENARAVVDSGTAAGVAANVAATVLTPVESMSNAFYILDRAFSGKRINPKSQWRQISIGKENVRAETFQSIKDVYGEGTLKEKIASLGYEIYCNRGDSLMNSLAFGNIFQFEGKFGKIASSFGGSTPMGATAALNAAAEAVENGANVDQVWLIAGATFLSETMTEAITYGNIKDALGTAESLSSDTLKGILKKWLTEDGLEEVFGESFTDVIQNAADRWAATMAHSNYQDEFGKAVEKYLAEGYGDRAEEMAIRDQVKGVLHTAFVSYLSAGGEAMMAVGKSAVNGTNYYRAVTKNRQKIGYSESTIDNMLNDWRKMNGIPVAETQTDVSGETVADTAGMAEEVTQAEAAEETAQAEPEQQVPAEEKTEEQKQAEEEKKEVAADIITMEQTKKSDSSTQTAAMAAALKDKHSFYTGRNTAAAAFATSILGNNAMDIIQDALSAAEQSETNADHVRSALQYAILGYGQARQVLTSDEYKNASPTKKCSMLLGAYFNDFVDEKVTKDVETKVTDYRKTRVITQLAGEGHFDQAVAARAEADKASETAQRVHQDLETQQSVEQAAAEETVRASEAMRNDPSKENANALTKAVTKQDNMSKVTQEYEQAAKKADQDQQAAEAKAEQAANDAMNSARAIADQQIAQEDQEQAAIEYKEQFHQDLIDNGIIMPESDEFGFASDEEMEARQNANFSENGDTIQYIGDNTPDMVAKLENAGFQKETSYNSDTGESSDIYSINSEDTNIGTLKSLNDEANRQRIAEADELSGKAEEDRQNAAIEQAVAEQNLEPEQAEERTEALKERRTEVKENQVNLNGKVSTTEGMLALHAFERKLGVSIGFADLPDNVRGKYQDGKIYLNQKTLNKGSMLVGQALVEASLHEITHYMENTGAYKGYRNTVLGILFGDVRNNATSESLYENNAKYRAAVDAKIEQYKGLQELSVADAEKEIVADYARLKLANKENIQRFMDAGLGGKMRNALHNINQALKNYFGRMTGEERRIAENLRRAERAFQRAMNEAAKTAVHPESSQFSVMQIAQSTGMTFDDKTLQLFDKNGNEVDGVKNKIMPDMINETPVGMLINSGLKGEQQTKAKEMMAGLMNMVARYKDSDLVWELGATTLSSTFSAIKSNSDPQYRTTVDFGTVCSKTQAIVDTLSEVMLNKIDKETGMIKDGLKPGLTRTDVMKVYDAVNKAGLSVPCPVCYVFSRWMGVPSLLGQMSKYQHDFVVTSKDENGKTVFGKNGKAVIDKEATQELVNNYLKKANEIGDAKAINKLKGTLQGKVTKLENKRIELETQAMDSSLTEDQKKEIKEQVDSVLAELTETEDQLGDVSAYNWITQALCKQDKDGNFVVDDKFSLTPDEILFDLNRTGDFAKDEKNWTYRKTRGAGMGKSIMPYSGETIGDILYGVKAKGRQIKNPWLDMLQKPAENQLKNARTRAKQQNLVGGQRLQSTSDFRPEWGLDYIMSFLELQAANSKVQMYTKVAEAVDFFASVGADVNLSIMGKGTGWHEATAKELSQMTDEQKEASTIDGKTYVMDFSDVTGMKYGDAMNYKNKYDNVQMILVGMNDTHIRLAMKNNDIDFIIPWHSSGNSQDVLARLNRSLKEKLDSSNDYSTVQTDKASENRTDEQKALWDARVKLLTKGNNALTQAEREILLSNDITKELYRRFTEKGYDDECYGVKLTSGQANQIFPYEYWDTTSTKENADVNGKRFTDYCEAMGLTPRFSQFKDEPGYWKMLIDRPMYDNNGNYRSQQIVDVTNAKIGNLNESGKLENSDLPTQAQAKYAPKDPRNPNYEKYTEAQKSAVEYAEAELYDQYDDGSEGQFSVMGDELTEADKEMIKDAATDLDNAIANGDEETATEDSEYLDDAYQQILDGHGLLITHALSIDSLTSLMRLEGIPSPSLAIHQTTHGLPNKSFGGVTFVFDKSTIDPQIENNYAYGRDSWTPVFPETKKSIFSKKGRFVDTGKIVTAERAVDLMGTQKQKGGYLDMLENEGYDIDIDDNDGILYQLQTEFSKNYQSIQEIQADRDRLGNATHDETVAERAKYETTIDNLKNVIISEIRAGGRNPEDIFTSGSKGNAEALDVIGAFRVVMNGNKGNPYHLSDFTIRNMKELIKNLQEIPAMYGEAKPNRVVDWNEVKGVVAPYSTPTKILEFFAKKGIPIYTFDNSKQKADIFLNNKNIQKMRFSAGGEMTEADMAMEQNTDQQEMPSIDQTLLDSGVITEKELARMNKTDVGEGTRQWGTHMAQDMDELADQAREYVLNHSAYQQDTNKEQIERAVEWFKKQADKQGSVDQAYTRALTQITDKKFNFRSADGQARMAVMMGMAIARNDIYGQVQIANQVNKQGTALGQALQSRKLFRLMTPEGRISTLARMLDEQKNELIAKGKTEEAQNLKFSDWLIRAAAAAENEGEMDIVRQAAVNELAEQLPASFADRIRELRMVSMLANPRTHIRNIVGNALFVPVVSLKNKLAAFGEIVTGQEDRTKTLKPISSSEVRNFAREQAKSIKDVLKGEAKFNETTQIKKAQSESGGLLGVLSKANSAALEGEDWFFLKGHFRRAFGGWMTANGYTVEQLKSNPGLLQEGRQYAVDEAQKATYRDFNEAAAKLNALSRDNKTIWGKGLGFVSEAVLPFKKTPMNILRRGLEYSPLGIAKSVTSDMIQLYRYNKAMKDLESGKITEMPDNVKSPNQVIDDFCSGLSGTMVMALGFMLAGTGAVSCGMDDDEDEFEKLKGQQKYSVNLGKAGNAIVGLFGVPKLFGEDVTYTMDWAAPMAMPFFVGAAIRNSAEEDQEGFDYHKVLNSILSISEPVFNLSMLDGLNSVFKTSQYEETNELTQIGAKIASNYVSSYVPSFLGAIARTDDPYNRKAFVESGKGTGAEGTFRYAWEQFENKIPGVSKTNIPNRDIWGRPKSDELWERIVENFISPGYIEHYKEDPIINEMERLFTVTGDDSIVPKTDPEKSYTMTRDGEKEKIVFTAEQWDKYKEVRGQEAQKLFTELMNSENYNAPSTTDKMRVEMFSKVWKQATDIGRKAVIPDYEVKNEGTDVIPNIIRDSKVEVYLDDMLKYLKAGQQVPFETMVEAVKEEYNDDDVGDQAVKDKIGNYYRDKWKRAYRENDTDTMEDIELILNGTDYDFNVYGNNGWQDAVEKENE